MNPINNAKRRQLLKAGCAALAAIPVVTMHGQALAATNPSLRSSLKYQDQPMGDKRCGNCAQFVPGPSATAPGGCKVIPGDNEISPQGYCVAWAKKP